MVFQEPMTLNPAPTIGDQIMEAIILHQDCISQLPEEGRSNARLGENR
jgi:ABC-type microcin C transport system duplicated ATPase subunit YejF